MPGERPPQSPSPSRPWYGWQTLLADGLSIATMYAGGAGESGGAVVAGFLGLVFLAPIVHFTHDNGSAGTISLGVRGASALAFIVGGLLVVAGAFDEGESHGGGDVPGAVLLVGGVLGAGVMVVVDAAALAYEAPRAPRYTDTRAMLAPWVDHRSRSAGLRFALTL
jgi:hypothetical protein